MKKLLVITLVVLVAVSGLLLYFLPQEMRFRPPYPITQTPADVGLSFEVFTISPEDEDLKLAGWWMPAKASRATLVFIHGGGSNRHSEFFKSLDFYAAMVAGGVSVAVVDLRNHGDSDSDGRGLQFGRTEKWDALALIDWAHQKAPDSPLYAMGISMGGATLIQAANEGMIVDGLILLDPLLDTHDAITQSAWVATGLPPRLFNASAWAATQWHGMPRGDEQASEIAARLNQPILLLQDPDDPVTRAPYARKLAAQNPAIRYWEAPSAKADAAAELQWRGRWGSHVTAFVLFPERVLEQVFSFMDLSPQR
ncbi:MAG: alpha/beta fold hydrolase [Halioglobus sp.]